MNILIKFILILFIYLFAHTFVFYDSYLYSADEWGDVSLEDDGEDPFKEDEKKEEDTEEFDDSYDEWEDDEEDEWKDDEEYTDEEDDWEYEGEGTGEEEAWEDDGEVTGGEITDGEDDWKEDEKGKNEEEEWDEDEAWEDDKSLDESKEEKGWEDDEESAFLPYADTGAIDEIEGIFEGLNSGEIREIKEGYSGKKFEETFTDYEWSTIVGANEDVYEIEVGDTLWDICNRLLDNPYYWPKLWQLNQYITNPHFIYPGSKLHFFPGSDVLPPSMKVVRKGEEEDLEEDEFQDKASEDVEEVRDGMELESEQEQEGLVGDDLFRKTEYSEIDSIEESGYKINYHMNSLITERPLSAAGKILDSKTERNYLQILDVVQLDVNVGVSPGDQFGIFKEEAKIYNPVGGRFIGYKNKILGVVLVISVTDNIVQGRLISVFDLIERGDFLTTEPIYFSDIKSKLSDQNLEGHIICPENLYFENFGSFSVVYINLGAENGLVAGNILRIVRRERLNKRADINDDDIAEEIVGLMMVLNVQKSTASAIVLSSKRPLTKGDRVVMLTPAMLAKVESQDYVEEEDYYEDEDLKGEEEYEYEEEGIKDEEELEEEFKVEEDESYDEDFKDDEGLDEFAEDEIKGDELKDEELKDEEDFEDFEEDYGEEDLKEDEDEFEYEEDEENKEDDDWGDYEDDYEDEDLKEDEDEFEYEDEDKGEDL